MRKLVTLIICLSMICNTPFSAVSVMGMESDATVFSAESGEEASAETVEAESDESGAETEVWNQDTTEEESETTGDAPEAVSGEDTEEESETADDAPEAQSVEGTEEDQEEEASEETEPAVGEGGAGTDDEEEAALSVMALPEAEVTTYSDLDDYIRAVSELTCDYETDGEGTLVIDTSSGDIESQDGEILERAGEAVMEAAGMTAQEAAQLLEDTDYEVLSVAEDEVVISDPYETCRLMVTSDTGVDTSGAVEVISYGNEYILQYATSGDAAQAAELLQDSVDSLDVDLLMDVAEESDWVYEAESWLSELEMHVDADTTASGSQGKFENQDDYLSWAVSYLGIDQVLASYSEAQASETVVAVIDSGFDNVAGWFDEERILEPLTVCSNGDTSDCNSSKHGTFVLGQIYEATPSCVKLLPVRAYNDNGALSTTQLKAALNLIRQYEEESGVDVDLVNISLGTSGSAGVSYTGASIDRVLSSMNGDGTFFMASAGNNATSVKESYPAKSRYVCAVSAIDRNGKFASSFSNYGDDDYAIAYAAPGTFMTGISPTTSSGTSSMQGTSMASPNALACAAILRSQGKMEGLTNVDDFISALDNYVQADRTAGTDASRYGAGCLAFPADIGFAELSIRNYYYNYADGQVYSVRPASYQNGLVVKAGADTLVKDVDYTVTYENNIDPGEATAIVTGMGMYDGTITGTFRIYGKITDCEVELEEAVYTGQAIEPEPDVIFHGKTLVKDTDYTLSYENNTQVGTASVTITGIGDYLLSKTVSFSIIPRDITTVYINEIPEQNYTGEAIEPELTVSVMGWVLSEGVDYVVDYQNNIMPGRATVTVTGLGGYVSERTIGFDIVGSMADCEAAVIPDYSFTGSAIEPEPVLTFGGTTLEKGRDYTLTYEDNIGPGNAVCIATGAGSFEGEKRLGFSIFGDFTTCEISGISDFSCTGTAIVPEAAVTFQGQTLEKGRDYIISCAKNTRPGYAVCILTGTAFYEGEIKKDFTIRGDISECELSLSGSYPYTGSAITPEPKVSLHGIVLKKDEDYTLSYESNIAMGQGVCTVTGIGFCEGEIKTSFTIYGAMSDCENFPLKDACYTGKAITPDPEVYFNGKILVRDRDYVVSYENNIYPGTATCIINGVEPYYKGTLETRFDISLRKTSLTSVKNTKSGIYLKWKALSEADGYRIYRKTGSDSFEYIATASGANTVTYTDKDAASGKMYTYKVVPYVEVDGIKVAGESCSAWMLRLACPGVKAANAKDGISLSWSPVNGAESYIVYRKSGKKSGSSSYKKLKTITDVSKVTYTDKTAKSGSYYTYKVEACNDNVKSACTEKEYYRLEGLGCSCTNKASGIKVSWKSVKGADGYYVYRRKTTDKSYTMIGKTKASRLYYTDKTASNGVNYRYYVKAYKGSYISAFHSSALWTRVSRVKISKLKSAVRGRLEVKWKRNSKASGYQICYATNSSFKNASKIRIKNACVLNRTIKGLRSGMQYYVKVRPYRTVNGKNYYGSWSSVIKIRVR